MVRNAIIAELLLTILQRRLLRTLFGMMATKKLMDIAQSNPDGYTLLLASKIGTMGNPVVAWMLLDIISILQRETATEAEDQLPKKLFYGFGNNHAQTKIGELKRSLETVFNVREAISLMSRVSSEYAPRYLPKNPGMLKEIFAAAR